MKKSPDFHDFILYDLLGSKLDNITSRPMMSGWCVYASEVPFAAIIGNNFYIKTKDLKFVRELEGYGSEKFSYRKKDGKTVAMNYWLIPEELFDNVELILEIAERVIEQSRKKEDTE